MKKFAFTNLNVWKETHNLIRKIYKLQIPNDEKYALRQQLIRSAPSISLNIAGGYGRDSQKELIRFLHIAKGSAYETYDNLLILNEIYEIDVQELLDVIDHICAMLSNLIKRITLNTKH